MTAKERHRQGLIDREIRPVRLNCALVGLNGNYGHCSGPVQADHVVEVQRLRELWRRSHSRGHRPTEAVMRLRDVTLDDLIADSDNGWWLCVRHHHLKSMRLIEIPRRILPASVERFAERFGLLSYLDRDFGVRRDD